MPLDSDNKGEETNSTQVTLITNYINQPTGTRIIHKAFKAIHLRRHKYPPTEPSRDLLDLLPGVPRSLPD